jgi:hypothetical protein
MKAIGKNIDNESIEFDFKSNIYCSNNQLTELKLPNGVEYVDCHNNQLTELILPNGIKVVHCYVNQLTELNIPDGVKNVTCFNNPIKEITLPNSINNALLPLNCIVLNLDEFKNRDDIIISFR